MTNTTPPTFFLTIKHDRLWIKPIDDFGDEQSNLISSTDDLRQFLFSKANEYGVSVDDLNLSCSSSVDFPEDETDDAATIALAHDIRDPDWENILGPKLNEE